MKISRSIFEKGILPRSNKKIKEVHPILLFLRKNYRWSFNIEDIVKETKVSPNTCHGTLRRLVDKKLIERKKLEGSNKSFYITITKRDKSPKKKKVKKTKKQTQVVKIKFGKTRKKKRR